MESYPEMVKTSLENIKSQDKYDEFKGKIFKIINTKLILFLTIENIFRLYGILFIYFLLSLFKIYFMLLTLLWL